MNLIFSRNLRHSLIVNFIILISASVNSQTEYPLYDFKPPLEIPLYLSGNFAELRSNHFHGGIDIKTQGVTGFNVLSSAKGYVSRINVSPYGYGNAIYIRHPNGYTTVYGHLKKFSPEIAKYVKEQQYAKKSFKVQLFPPASRFPVETGQVIGISGNSGGSYAPHLHFEIRETVSEVPVNPLLFGFDIKDDIPPVLSRLFIYPLSVDAEIQGKKGRQSVTLKGANGNYSIPATLKVSGEIGFGLSLFDRLNTMPNKCGIYEIKLYKDDILIYHQKMEKIPFHEKRYINALTDYEEKQEHNRWIVKNFVMPNNKLNVYEKVIENGKVKVNPGSKHAMKYEITDTYGNLSKFSFELEGVNPISSNSALVQKPSAYFKYDKPNSFENKDVMLYLPANVLYEDLDFNFWIDAPLGNSLTPVYNIHDLNTPLHSYVALSIKAEKIKSSIRKYCMIVSLDKDGGIVPEGGYWKGDYLVVKTRSFGAYTVMVDSIKPKITPINISNGKNVRGQNSIIIRVEDNLSGVTKYNGYIDDNWVLFEFDYKKKRIIHELENLQSGNHTFRLEVEDKKGNKSFLKFNFSS